MSGARHPEMPTLVGTTPGNPAPKIRLARIRPLDKV